MPWIPEDRAIHYRIEYILRHNEIVERIVYHLEYLDTATNEVELFDPEAEPEIDRDNLKSFPRLVWELNRERF
jgi:hypothetical protein